MVATVSTSAAVTAAIAPTVAATVSTVLCQCGHIDSGNRCRARCKSQRERGQGR
jgi:hypothetical protein